MSFYKKLKLPGELSFLMIGVLIVGVTGMMATGLEARMLLPVAMLIVFAVLRVFSFVGAGAITVAMAIFQELSFVAMKMPIFKTPNGQLILVTLVYATIAMMFLMAALALSRRPIS